MIELFSTRYPNIAGLIYTALDLLITAGICWLFPVLDFTLMVAVLVLFRLNITKARE